MTSLDHDPAAAAPPPTGAPLPGAVPGLDLAELAASAGLRRIHILAWRDLDDPEAGGSELHAARIAERWAAAGLEVTMRSSHADGHPHYTRRDGYQVIRKAGRYGVFPRTALSGLVGRTGDRDAMVEIWNGMPFFSPLWTRCPRVVFLHHVHAEMWRMVIHPPALAKAGEAVELRLAPPVYRRSRIVTLSESSRQEIIDLLHLPAANIDVVPPGVEPRFGPAPDPKRARSERPLVVAVGRLVPVKRFDLLIAALTELKVRHPDLEAVIVGEGYERPALEARRRAAGAEDWIHLPGHLEDDALVELYRKAWVLASTSAREGWGMTITEAAACGTPAVVTRIAGHLDAVEEGGSGLLVEAGADPLAGALDAVLANPLLREKLSRGAVERAARLTWEATARGTLAALVAEARRRRPAPPAAPAAPAAPPPGG
ncbi:MAG TPA: glycosyltransferase family 4 protein [Acidimicrobiales bacterium]